MHTLDIWGLLTFCVFSAEGRVGCAAELEDVAASRPGCGLGEVVLCCSRRARHLHGDAPLPSAGGAH